MLLCNLFQINRRTLERILISLLLYVIKEQRCTAYLLKHDKTLCRGSENILNQDKCHDSVDDMQLLIFY